VALLIVASPLLIVLAILIKSTPRTGPPVVEAGREMVTYRPDASSSAARLLPPMTLHNVAQNHLSLLPRSS
jgi:hypothetical protein